VGIPGYLGRSTPIPALSANLLNGMFPEKKRLQGERYSDDAKCTSRYLIRFF